MHDTLALFTDLNALICIKFVQCRDHECKRKGRETSYHPKTNFFAMTLTLRDHVLLVKLHY